MKKSSKKKVIKHLKKDIKTFKHEAHEDRELIRDLKHKSKHEKSESKKHEKKEHKKDPKKKDHRKKDKYSAKAEKKISKVMREYSKGQLHSSSKKGPVVTNPKQAQAIAISEARRKGLKVPKRKKKK